MKAVDSLNKVHDDAAGLVGDCHRACIASLLELNAEEVPHFYDYPMEESGDQGTEAQRVWLAERGLAYVEIPTWHKTVDESLSFVGYYAGDVHYLLVGKSRLGFAHIVVCHGVEVVHDPTYGLPHGLAGPTDDGHFWFGFIVKLL